jgi:hypothetical protein
MPSPLIDKLRIMFVVLFVGLLAFLGVSLLSLAQQPSPQQEKTKAAASKKHRQVNDQSQGGVRGSAGLLSGRIVCENGEAPRNGWVRLSSSAEPSRIIEASVKDGGIFEFRQAISEGQYVLQVSDGAMPPTTYSDYYVGRAPSPMLVLRLKPGGSFEFRGVDVSLSGTRSSVSEVNLELTCTDGSAVNTNASSSGRTAFVNLLATSCRITARTGNRKAVTRRIDLRKTNQIELVLP